ncbi:MAG: 16S rRNA processing protein RimM [Cyclobacteriaceae bacterium]|nr:16S rRNA processing protein RimM [Cyclobacteriaceae bacterium]
MERSTCFKIGYVAKTHGLKGEVTIMYTDVANLESVKSVFIEVRNDLVPYFIEHVSSRKDKAFIKFEDVNTLEAATMLKGSSIYLDKSQRPKLKRGEFYDDEVIDFTVEDEDLGLLGAVKEVAQSGPNRLLSLDYLGKEVLIPINGPFILSINKTKKKIIVLLPDGFLDL